MTSARLTKINLVTVLIVFAFVVATSGAVFAEDCSLDMPENTSTARYGSGWKCDRGYRADTKVCVAIKVPANEYLSDASHGPGW
jgi:hypothetical protein